MPISVTISPQVAATSTNQTISFAAMVTGDSLGVTWQATAGAIDASGNFTAPSGPQSATVTVIAASRRDPTKWATATVNVVAPGQVSTTANVQVALYTLAPAAPGNVSVQFGLDTGYGLTTWAQPVPTGGGAVSLFVAGMKGNTLYHMRGVVQFGDGSQFLDADRTFTTGAVSASQGLTITAATTPGMTAQGGVEVLDLASGGPNIPSPPVVVTDLSGDMLWTYNSGLLGPVANPVKLLPNGHFLINFSEDTVVDGTN